MQDNNLSEITGQSIETAQNNLSVYDKSQVYTKTVIDGYFVTKLNSVDLSLNDNGGDAIGTPLVITPSHSEIYLMHHTSNVHVYYQLPDPATSTQKVIKLAAKSTNTTLPKLLLANTEFSASSYCVLNPGFVTIWVTDGVKWYYIDYSRDNNSLVSITKY